MKRCPECGIFFSDGEDLCDQDRSPLQRTDGIIDRYQIVERLGVGGMGTVYRAVHTLLDNRVVAIKLLHRQLSQHSATVDRFFREARAASRVENEHIIEVIDFGVTPKGDSFLVMEYLDGICLRDLLEEQGRLSLRRALNIGLQVAEALYAVHRKGIVHRDLKPENVMLVKRDEREFVKLLDFGIAKLTDPQETNLTRVGMVIGTPAYMSPEQAGGEGVDLRTDVYALGTILYEMLTGRCPFEAESAKQVLLAQLTQEPARPRQLRPEIPAAIEGVILHALHKEREERPQSMLQFACELRDALALGPAEQPEPLIEPVIEPAQTAENIGPSRGSVTRSLLERVSRFARAPHSRRWLSLGGLGAGLVLGIGITLLALRPAEEALAPLGPAALATPPAKPTTAPAEPTRPAGPPSRSSEVSVRLRRPEAPTPGSQALAPDLLEELGELTPRPSTRPSSSLPRSHRGRTRRASSAVAPARASRGSDEPASAWSARLVSRPSGAIVSEGGETVGKTPWRLDTSRPRVLRVEVLGYDPQVVRIAMHQRGTITVTLKEAAVAWEVSSLSKLTAMRDQGQISKSTFNRKAAALRARRDRELLELKTQYETDQLTRAQYERATRAVEKTYR